MGQRLPFSGERDVYAMPVNSRASQASVLLQKIDEEVGRPSTVIPAQAGNQGEGGSRPALTAKNIDTRLHGHDGRGLREMFCELFSRYIRLCLTLSDRSSNSGDE